MDGTRSAPLLGIAGCLAAIVALVAPYLVAGTGAVGVYYDAGAGPTPLVAGLFAAVAIIVLAAGRADRTDGATAAGVGLVFGICIAGLAVVWAVTVPETIVFQLSRADLVAYHRWVLAAVSLAVPIGGAWYARALGVV